MISREITYCGQKAVVGCDALCTKAWGIMCRPNIQLSHDDDDVVYLGDSELGEAPEDPGTYEGSDAKPMSADGRLNTWCVRQCERSAITEIYRSSEPLKLPDWSRRVYNIPGSPAAKAHQAAEGDR